jgi:hypothetical protein
MDHLDILDLLSRLGGLLFLIFLACLLIHEIYVDVRSWWLNRRAAQDDFHRPWLRHPEFRSKRRRRSSIWQW